MTLGVKMAAMDEPKVHALFPTRDLSSLGPSILSVKGFLYVSLVLPSQYLSD
jgi:hypothetical protein